MAIKLTSTDSLLQAIKAAPATVFSVEKKRGPAKESSSMFLDVFVTVNGDKREPWLQFENVTVAKSIGDPNDPELKKDKQRYAARMNVQTSVSRAGSLGEVLNLLDPIWLAKAAELSANKTVDIEGKKIHALVKRELSKKNKENPNGPIEDPVIYLKIDFKPFPDRYPKKFLQGQPKCQLFDWNKRYIDEAGKEQFRPATVKNEQGVEEPVGEHNVHKFITGGSIIRKGRMSMTSASVSEAWFSVPLALNWAVIETASNAGWEEPEDSTSVDALAQQVNQMNSSAQPAPVPAPVAVVTSAPVAVVSAAPATPTPAAESDLLAGL